LTLSAKDTGNNINYVTTATYGPDSALTGFISGYSTSFAGITNAFSYNKRLQPVNMSANAPSQTVFSIGYDFHVGNGTTGADNGNVFGITNYKDQNRNQTFTYDLLNRLISAQNAGTNCAASTVNGKSEYWGNSYGYDAWGNLLQKSVTKCGAENLLVTADAHNWIHASGTDYQYDAAGNMTFNATPPTQTYSYDQENRLTGAAGYAYTYDADGNRVRKSSGSTGTLYWYMTPGIVGESDLSGNLTDEYVFFDGERVARKSTNGVFYYFSDHLKTASVITDSAGNVKSESDFYPWGGELQFVNNDTNHYKFTGKERDSETQLDYFGARYYSDGLGRWVSADWSPTPIAVPYADFGDPQSLNLYGYVRGLPTTKADIDGHNWWDSVKAWTKDAAKSLAIGADKGLRSATTKFAGPAYGEAVGARDIAGNDLVRPANTTEQIGFVATETTVTVILIAPIAEAAEGEVAVSSERLPQDVNVNPRAPAANNGNGTVGPSTSQNAAAQGDAAAAKAAGHTDIRMNQQQVNAQGQRVGVNRPDLQSTDANGVRHYTEYDRSAQSAADHHARTTANDPDGVTHTKIDQ
jgi:RHS repeat-associated protein